jgi:hypothetical protein
MEILWNHLDEDAWTQAMIRGGGAPLQQSWDYGQAMQALGSGVRRGVVRVGGRDIGLVQALERCGVRLISRGPIWLDDADAAVRRRIIMGLADRLGPTFATPGEATRGNGLCGFGMIPVVTAQHHALWDLRPDADALRAGLCGK